jgi:hypothetical protein
MNIYKDGHLANVAEADTNTDTNFKEPNNGE